MIKDEMQIKSINNKKRDENFPLNIISIKFPSKISKRILKDKIPEDKQIRISINLIFLLLIMLLFLKKGVMKITSIMIGIAHNIPISISSAPSSLSGNPK
jgi:hypothetical protein